MKRVLKITAKTFAVLFCLLLIAAVAGVGYYIAVTGGEKLDQGKLALSNRSIAVYDNSGELLEELSAGKGRETVSISALPDYLPNAFVAVEDKNFYRHHGVDYKRIVKAAMKNIASFSFREGASTISQQLIKNTHLTGEKTINRKLKEIRLTKKLEKKYTKEQILELYLNSIYFGHDSFGVANASYFYFGKSPEELSPADSATLAALVKSPNRYSPFKNPEKCLARRNFVLSLMKEQGYLSSEDYSAAMKEPLPVTPQNAARSPYLNLVLEELSALLPDAKASDFNGMKVYTACDKKVQTLLENHLDFDSDVSEIVRDNSTGMISAFASTVGTIRRLPASAIKPLLVYAPALEENLISPATPLLDEKVDFGGYSPTNYGGSFGGYMSARYALSHSVNIPAVKLLNALGVDKACGYLDKMDMPVEQGDRSLSLALGGMKNGFTLKELIDGYSVFPSGGLFSPSSCIVRIESRNGRTLFEFSPQKRKVFSEDVCSLMNDMLETCAKEGTAKKLRTLPFPVCAKTGTAGNKNGNTDAYTVAYTKEHSVGVWMGNADNSPVSTTGGGLPAGTAYEILKGLYGSRTPVPLSPSKDVVEVGLDSLSYEKEHRLLRADPAAPAYTVKKELFRSSSVPEGESSRFSRPSIEKPNISCKNGAVYIELCQAEYYDYVVKRQNGGKITTIYSGKYIPLICDNAVSQGELYTYTVLPVYRGTEGEAVTLPSVLVKSETSLPDHWWE